METKLYLSGFGKPQDSRLVIRLKIVHQEVSVAPRSSSVYLTNDVIVFSAFKMAAVSTNLC